jgi:hypothetical protein
LSVICHDNGNYSMLWQFGEAANSRQSRSTSALVFASQVSLRQHRQHPTSNIADIHLSPGANQPTQVPTPLHFATARQNATTLTQDGSLRSLSLPTRCQAHLWPRRIAMAGRKLRLGIGPALVVRKSW